MKKMKKGLENINLNHKIKL